MPANIILYKQTKAAFAIKYIFMPENKFGKGVSTIYAQNTIKSNNKYFSLFLQQGRDEI